jgi:hypothetical protein
MQKPTQSESRENDRGSYRFTAVVTRPARREAMRLVSELGLDRLPDRDRKIHLLITADDARRLLERGVQVELLSVNPVAPLNPSLVFTDEAARADLERRLKGVPRARGA